MASESVDGPELVVRGKDISEKAESIQQM